MTDRALRAADAFLVEMAIFFREHDMTQVARASRGSNVRHSIVPVPALDNLGPQKQASRTLNSVQSKTRE